jgi:ABC-type sulfate transport system permease component
LIDRDGSALLRALPALLVVALATLVPLAYLVIAAPNSVGGWTGLLQDEPYASRISFTLLQSTLAAVLAGLAVIAFVIGERLRPAQSAGRRVEGR